jgi:molybdate/tungstate transport system substrate-binding protein
MADSFKKMHPAVNMKLESSGSVDAARKISDLNRSADIMASADYKVIENLLIPNHATWLIKFAANEMTLVYDEDSQYAEQINQQNWQEIILRDDVIYGRSDPDSDPCGYRSVLTLQLAEEYYHKDGLAKQILNKDQNYIRPKETDLLALLESKTLDYIFLYRSVARQHGLQYLILPDSVNLGNPNLANHYANAKVNIAGKKPGEKMTMTGEPMVYGITMTKNSPNPKAAKAFLHYVLSEKKGLDIMTKNGQPALVPSETQTYPEIPEEFKKYAKNPKN